jgi:hypothetical protein
MDRHDAPRGARLLALLVRPGDADHGQAVHLRDVGGAELEHLLHPEARVERDERRPEPAVLDHHPARLFAARRALAAGPERGVEERLEVRAGPGVARGLVVRRVAQSAGVEAERTERILADELALGDEAAEGGEEELQVDVDRLRVHGRRQDLGAFARHGRAIGKRDRGACRRGERLAQDLGRRHHAAEIASGGGVAVDRGLRPGGWHLFQLPLERGSVLAGDCSGRRIADEAAEQAHRDRRLLAVTLPPWMSPP